MKRKQDKLKTQNESAGAKKEFQSKKISRRGRKREPDYMIIEHANEKISSIKEKLANAKEDGMSLIDRRRYRNQISAQQARIRRKEEQIFLNKSNREKDARFTKFVKLLAGSLGQE